MTSLIMPTRRSNLVRKLFVGLALILIIALFAVHHQQDNLAKGLSLRGQAQAVSDVRLLQDLTFVDEKGQRQSEQEIFDEVFRLIEAAERLIVLDMFLFNDFQGSAREDTRALSGELTDALINRKRTMPDLKIVVISDPVNTVYGGLKSTHFDALRAAGIEVIETNLDALRDSNLLYSALWRLLIKPYGNAVGASTLPNPFGPGEVSLRSWLRLVNFKANHRKLLVADSGDTWSALVSSANPHDGSSAHGNMALVFSGLAVGDLLQSERVVARLSGADFTLPELSAAPPTSARATIRVLTESKIKQAALENIRLAGDRDAISLQMFYLSDRDIIQALIDASARGASVRALLDPNKDAFGRSKNGIPNRQSGLELQRAGIDVRWCDTHGEQCHAKTLITHYASGESRMLTGSANFTRRNLQDYNLETDVLLVADRSHPVMERASALFEQRWHNRDGRVFSTAFETYKDESLWRYWLYRFMEASGMSTF